MKIIYSFLTELLFILKKMSNLFKDLSLSRIFSQQNQFGPLFIHQINTIDHNVSIAIELKHIYHQCVV